MGLREDAIAEIQSAKLHLLAAQSNLEPIEQVTGVQNAMLAYANILSSIVLCNQAIENLGLVPGNPLIQRAPSSLVFVFPAASGTIGVRNAGTGTLTGTISIQTPGGGPPPNWVTVIPSTFISTGLLDESFHVVTIDYGLIAAGATVKAEIVFNSNGGSAITTVEAQNGTVPGPPVLAATPPNLILTYPEPSEIFEILNIGDQTQPIAWAVTEYPVVNWVGANPLSGTVTTERDPVVVTPDWSTFPSDQTTTRNMQMVVDGLFQGNPVQGSPTVIEVTATRTAAPPPPPPPPPSPPGFCAEGRIRASGWWSDWCVDDPGKFITIDAQTGAMGNNVDARRGVNLAAPNQGTAPPTAGSNRVIMECDMRFDSGWLQGLNLGGQHLMMFGRAPYNPSGRDQIRFDFGAASGAPYPDFSYGFDYNIYHRFPNGTGGVFGGGQAFKVANIFRVGVWT